MLEDVLAAATTVGAAWVVSPEPRRTARRGFPIRAAGREPQSRPRFERSARARCSSSTPTSPASPPTTWSRLQTRFRSVASPSRPPRTARRTPSAFRTPPCSRRSTEPAAPPGFARTSRTRRRRGPPRPPPRRRHARRPGGRVKVAVLSGGVGGARFVRGLVDVVAPRTSRSSGTSATTSRCSASTSRRTSTRSSTRSPA